MDLKIFAHIDNACLSQIESICSSPAFANEKVRVMPDAHSGVNSVIGFTSTVSDRAIPNVVGGDIGCGVLAIQLRRPKKGLDFTKIDKVIRSSIPYGVGSIHDIPIADFDYDALRCWDKLPNKHVIPKYLGSLGAGNHFIEIDYDGKNHWLVIHSGSRNLGTKVAEYYQGIAASTRSADVPFAMAFLSGQDLDDYLHDLAVCQKFASRNRSEIARVIMKNCSLKEASRIESMHNYIDADQMILRKGAIDASAGKKLVIPLNMAEGCILGVGLGNEDWNYSAPHGTGRARTRREARETIPMSEYRNAMKDVWSSCIAPDTIDESPGAYKDSEKVLATASETMEISSRMKAVYNFKAPDN